MMFKSLHKIISTLILIPPVTFGYKSDEKKIKRPSSRVVIRSVYNFVEEFEFVGDNLTLKCKSQNRRLQFVIV